jgi:flagellar hook-associated protein 3 FlgL
MERVSTNMPNDDMQYFARRREAQLLNTQNQIASQSRLQRLRDDPASAAHATRHQSFEFRLRRYSRNIETAQSRHREAEVFMQEAVSLLQRGRELALQGSNGTYTQEDQLAMASEINQLLNQLVETANARGGDGSTLFAGDKTRTLPFRTIEGRVEGFDEPVVSQVRYLGTIAVGQTEVADGSYVPLNFPGNRVFWAENQQIFSSVDAREFVAQQDSQIEIDGTEIGIRAGDNIFAVMSKINDSGASVRARLDPIRNGLVLESTSAHQLWVDEVGGGGILQDLGVLNDTNSAPPDNISSSARVFGGNMFDMLINVRDQLAAGNTIDVGGRSIGGIDSALDNILGRLGELGSFDQRLQISYSRTETMVLETSERLANEVDVDMTEAITNLRRLEQTHQAALGAAARIIRPTLLDFLR